MGKVDIETQVEIVNLHKAGISTRDIVLTLINRGKDVTRHNVQYWVKLYELGKFDPFVGIANKRSPQCFSISERDIDVITQVLTKQPSSSGQDVHTALMDDGASFRLRTTRNAIHAAGFVSASPREVPLVTNKNKKIRKEFCLDLISRNEDFHDVIFSDESTIMLNQYNHYGFKPKDSMDTCLPKPKHPLKLHVWGGISRRGATNLVIFQDIMDAEFYTHSIIEEHVLPFITETFPESHRFQQDNDPKHRSKKARTFMDNNHIIYPKWPAQSPDLNPIEMVWAQMKQHAAKMNPLTKDELAECVDLFWRKVMTVDLCNRYIDHLYKVVPVVVLKKGESTGDIPNRLFLERSSGKNISYFNDKLRNDEGVKARAHKLLGESESSE